MASAGGQLRALNGLQSGSPPDLAIGIDASEINGEINGPVWSGIRPRDYGGQNREGGDQSRYCGGVPPLSRPGWVIVHPPISSTTC
jgi:hypothetical protein